MILIGSKAIKYWYPDFPREPKDTDYVVSSIPKHRAPNTEYLENPILYKYIREGNICPSNILTTLKASHLMWDINWEKHMFDLQFLLKKGNKIDKELFFELYDYWNVYHLKNTRSDLKMSKDEFFTNAINYDTIQHDELHKLINPIPLYTKILKDECEVELDSKKWEKLSFEEKIGLIREETYIMAWERFKKYDYRVAYSKMLKKFIISHAPTFTLTFILENYIELHKPTINYIKQINEQLKRIKSNIKEPERVSL